MPRHIGQVTNAISSSLSLPDMVNVSVLAATERKVAVDASIAASRFSMVMAGAAGVRTGGPAGERERARAPLSAPLLNIRKDDMHAKQVSDFFQQLFENYL